jgi:release factor glutamine methyltransferase
MPDARAHTGSSPPQTDAWTTRTLLAWIGDHFRSAGLDSPRLCAEMLMAHVLGCDRLRLYTDPDRPASNDERARLRDLVRRAARHEPIQYIVGEAWFFSLPFSVTSAVLIPRPATETLVEHALQWLRAHHLEEPPPETAEEVSESDEATPPDPPRPVQRPVRIADIGVGSGAIAIALAANWKSAEVVATDISADALAVARANADRHGVKERITFLEGDLLQPLKGHAPFDLLVSNPPYIPDSEWDSVAPNVRDHEPVGALRAGPDGLDCLRPLLQNAAAQIRPDGLLLVEHAASHAEHVRALIEGAPAWADVRTIDDLERHPRLLAARRTDVPS